MKGHTIRSSFRYVQVGAAPLVIALKCFRVHVYMLQGVDVQLNGAPISVILGAGFQNVFTVGGVVVDGRPVMVDDVWTLICNDPTLAGLFIIEEHLDPIP